MKVKLNGQTAELPLHVVQGNFPDLFGHSWLENIKLNWNGVNRLVDSKTSLQSILEKYNSVFEDALGSLK